MRSWAGWAGSTATYRRCPRSRNGSGGLESARYWEYDKALVDFWNGRDNPPDTLNDGIRLLAPVLPYFGKGEAEAIDLIEGYIDALPESHCPSPTAGPGDRGGRPEVAILQAL